MPAYPRITSTRLATHVICSCRSQAGGAGVGIGNADVRRPDILNAAFAFSLWRWAGCLLRSLGRRRRKGRCLPIHATLAACLSSICRRRLHEGQKHREYR